MATKPAKKSLTFWRGNSEPFEFRLKNKLGEPFDLTGYELTMSVAHDNGVVTKRLSDGSIVCADLTTGVVSTEFSPTETRPMIMARRPGEWELELSTNDGYQRTLMHGPVVAEGGLNND